MMISTPVGAAGYTWPVNDGQRSRRRAATQANERSRYPAARLGDPADTVPDDAGTTSRADERALATLLLSIAAINVWNRSKWRARMSNILTGPGASAAGPHEVYAIHPIGHVRSELRALERAPRQGSEGAPDAWIEIESAFVRGLSGIGAGDELIVLTWLHRAGREVLEVHPRNDPGLPLTGVFATRSPHRPNPVGLHPVTVLAVAGNRLRVGPLEAIDGTPVIDIKVALGDAPA